MGSHRVRHDWSDLVCMHIYLGFPGSSAGKESAWNAGDLGSVTGSGTSPGGGHGNLLQYSCLENPRDRGAWRAAVYGVAQSWTQLKRLSSSSNHWQISIYHIRHCFSYPKSTRISVSVDFEILCVLKNFRDGIGPEFQKRRKLESAGLRDLFQVTVLYVSTWGWSLRPQFSPHHSSFQPAGPVLFALLFFPLITLQY